MALDVTPVYRNLRTRVTFAGLEAEDLFAILAVAVVMNICREISESGDVWPADEHGAAVHRSHPECPGADAVQVRQTARLPLGLGDVSHQAARLFGA